ncbi:MAG: DUF4007 family protein [Dehalococcoides mccartyi]|nr:DUF4007 family protein [Dehalococcoides mccartyi]MDN4186170.1 DUF4007 family protein [Dehalococcoides mccartyi]
MAGEAEAFNDETLLELLLTFAIDRKDVKPLAQQLIQNFGDLTNVLSARPDEILKIKGLGQSSVTLLQLVKYIRSGTIPFNTSQREQEATVTQPKLFGEKELVTQESKPGDENNKPNETPDITAGQESPNLKKPLVIKTNRRKFQISNGYLLEFDQFARILHFLLENKGAKKIGRKIIQEDTGLSDRQIENLVSMATAMGLIKPNIQILSPTGLLIAEHDIFIEKQGSLEWCHYVGAGSYRNLVWFEIFNNLLTEPAPMTQSEWLERLRNKLSGEFTAKTLGTGLREEVRFVLDAYLERNFNKLGILQHSQGERIYRRRYTNFVPLVLAAMIYDYCASKEDHLSQVSELVATPGSPAMVFGLDAPSFRQQIEGLHERGWIRYETTHSLDQIRLKPGFSALEFLTAHFEDREPRQVSNQVSRE